MFYQDDYERVSMILNDTKAYEKIAKALNLEEVDNDSEIFHDIEEFIVDKFREMKEEIESQKEEKAHEILEKALEKEGV